MPTQGHRRDSQSEPTTVVPGGSFGKLLLLTKWFRHVFEGQQCEACGEPLSRGALNQAEPLGFAQDAAPSELSPGLR